MLLLKFRTQFERFYGRKEVRINMRLHCHLKECIENYGPVYSFWCFAFERYNGILGSTSSNNRSIEIQLMRKFLCEQFVFNVSLPEEHSETFTASFNRYQTSQLSTDKVPVGSSALFHMSTHGQLGACIDWSDITYITLPSAYKFVQLDSDDRQLLAETYQAMYPDKHILPGMVGEVCRKYSSVLLAGEKIGSRLECRSLWSARIMASWADQDGQISSRAAFRPGIVLFLFANTIKFRGGQYQMHVFFMCNMVQRGLTERTLSASCGNLETEKFQPSWSCNFLASSEMLLQVCYCTGGGEWS